MAVVDVQLETKSKAAPASPESQSEFPEHVTLTTKAADMVRQAMEQEGLEEHALRVGVMGGGCSGLQYLLDFANEPNEGDYIVQSEGVLVYLDQFSAGHLVGTVIDYVDGGAN